MVTDEMVEKAMLSLYGSDFYDNWDRNTSFVVNREVGMRAALEAALSAAEHGTLQDRVHPWMMACFGPEISSDKLERGDRLLEEVFELLQSGNYPRERIRALEDYTYSREKGEPSQEVGGVMITLAAYCLAHDLDMHEAGETELARIWTKVEKIRAKQAAKPTGSALPIAVAAPPAPSVAVKALEWEKDTLTHKKDDGAEFPSSHYWIAKHHVPGLLLGWEISRFVDERFPKVTRSFVLRSGKNEKEFATLDEAKAAAQADYEARILSALSAQVQDVAGWQLVPKEPTEEMEKAGRKEAADCDDAYGSSIFSAAEIYRAMLAAAPAKQEGKP